LRAPGFWLGLTIGLSVAAVLLFLRFWRAVAKLPEP
jgi:Na+-driven multidrug efflux pump